MPEFTQKEMMTTVSETTSWIELELPEDAELMRKEWYTYRVGNQWFDIELFEKTTGQFYAIGTPSNKDKLIIYGSAVVAEAKDALRQAIQKINRDHFQTEIFSVGEDARTPADSGDR